MEVVTPHLSAPTTPKKHFGEYFFSAPTSPIRISEFCNDFDDSVTIRTRSVSAVLFDWEEKPSTLKSIKPNTPCEDDDFAFVVSEETEKTRLLPAEELFDCGKIRRLNPPPPIKLRSEKDECQNRKRFPIPDIRGAFSPRKKKELDPFGKGEVAGTKKMADNERGRERVSSLSLSNKLCRRGARSIFPYRVTKYPWEGEEEEQKTENTGEIVSKTNLSSSKSKTKWRLKDFFLFRSASEGRAADRDPLRKYTAFFKRRENAKNSSFRTVDGSDSGSSLRRRRRMVSAHELHYTANRAVSEDLKKKTFLPYKQGILGRLAFNPAVHALANGFGLSRK